MALAGIRLADGARGTRMTRRLESRRITMKLAKAALLLTLMSAPAWAQTNAGDQKSDPNLPFNMTTVTTFNLPWRMAFLPDGRMLITEKVGPVWLVTQQGQKTIV